jgi:long-subunit acyl-CoA synthetase (AMP-forming)
MAETVLARLDVAAARYAAQPALRHKVAGRWRTLTWADYRQQVRLVGRGFLALGAEPGSGVVILGANRPEWLAADLGAIAVGAVPAGIYTTSTADQARYIAAHCDAAVAVVERPEQAAMFQELKPSLPKLRAIVGIDGPGGGGEVLSWAELVARGGEVPEARLGERASAQRPADLATLIYTSGTTGTPKAVMLSHANLRFVAEASQQVLGLGPQDQFLSYLPLSHIAEQIVSVHLPLVSGACTWFAESLEKLGANLREVRPTFFVGVPRVWEKLQAAIQAAGAGAPARRRRLVAWARRKGLAGGYAEQQGRPRPALASLADRLVLGKVRRRLGLERARVCVTSAAPISLDTLEFFLSLGIPIYEVYGMSECTGPATFSAPGALRTGWAGRAAPGTEVRLTPDGEVLMRGPHVFLGYLKDEAATRETRDEEGWLHSGDVGELSVDGYLKITDRKKELLITAGGKNVAPQPIEGKLRGIPGVSQAVVVGDRKPFVAALLALDPLRLPALAAAVGSAAQTPSEAAACPRLRAYLEEHLARLNASLARYESVRRFEIRPQELSVDGGELTPTMKLKRRVIAQKHADLLERLYSVPPG